MARRSPALLLLALAAGGGGCGKIGDILPPLVLVPQRVDTLVGRQFGGEIVLVWRNPVAFIDGRALGPIAEVEIWLATAAADAPAGPEALEPEEFLARARLVAAVPPDKLLLRRTAAADEPPAVSYRFPLAAKDPAGTEYIFAVRVREAKRKKTSDLSNAVRVKPRLVSMPPDNVAAAVFQDRIEIRWDAPFENFDHSTPAQVRGYNVFKLSGSGPENKLNEAPLAGPPFADRDFVFGQPVRYFVRAVAGGEAVESADSRAVEVVPKDVFPPAVPTDLTALAGLEVITLSWNPNREPDFLGYKIWRRAEGSPQFDLLTASPLLENAYADAAVEKGRRYEYAVSAVDREKNESGRSQAVSEVIKDP
ncbi:MAG: hypothetical protein FJY82_11545 [Candidatus Aminicenantes bacterium]|nr:hypothetical protein [Candidatus Aminicenantes bacterium]